jgi:cellulose synthase/poly-beta-1,6-N-acetylglucosamine synthase-like glycosyltransferase
MSNSSWFLIAVPLALIGYAYVGYPAILWVWSRFRPDQRLWGAPSEWPGITITVPCYNEDRSIAATIESLLALDYPVEKRHILIISDASTDRTDDIVLGYSGQGVELLRLAKRGGKTAAENAAATRLRGDIVVNTDATIRLVPGALKELLSVFQDPTVGVASGRDLSVGDVNSAGNQGESGYVGYEMWIRSLETRIGTIVGASGCFFATRRRLYDSHFPEALSRDFASCLIAWEHGYRSVSVDTALALVPRAPSLRVEYGRKVRTMARGLGTLNYKRHLLNPFRYGRFSAMLLSHKLCRWLFQLTMPLVALAAVLLVLERPSTTPWILGGTILVGGIAGAAWWWPDDRAMPTLLAVPGYFIWSNLAGLMAWMSFFRRQRTPIWEPTRRPKASPGGQRTHV